MLAAGGLCCDPEVPRDILVARRLSIEALEIGPGPLRLASGLIGPGPLVSEGVEQFGRPIGGPPKGLRKQRRGRIGEAEFAHRRRPVQPEHSVDRGVVGHVLTEPGGLLEHRALGGLPVHQELGQREAHDRVVGCQRLEAAEGGQGVGRAPEVFVGLDECKEPSRFGSRDAEISSVMCRTRVAAALYALAVPPNLDDLMQEAIADLPSAWTFEGLRNVAETADGPIWQAWALRGGDWSWATGSGHSVIEAIADLVRKAIDGATQTRDPDELEPPHHQTVDLDLNGEPTPIDVEIAPLVLEINRAGLETADSCQQGWDGRAHIGFRWADDAAQFLAIVGGDVSSDTESLWSRITREDEPAEDWERFRRERMWSYTAGAYDLSAIFEGEGDDERLLRRGDPAYGFGIGVGFPPSDIPDLVAALQRYNTGGSPAS